MGEEARTAAQRGVELALNLTEPLSLAALPIAETALQSSEGGCAMLTLRFGWLLLATATPDQTVLPADLPSEVR